MSATDCSRHSFQNAVPTSDAPMPPSRLPPWQRAHVTAYWARPRSACSVVNTPSHRLRAGVCATTETDVAAYSATAITSRRDLSDVEGRIGLLLLHAGEAGGRRFGASLASELRPRRVLAERTRSTRIRSFVSVDNDEGSGY